MFPRCREIVLAAGVVLALSGCYEEKRTPPEASPYLPKTHAAEMNKQAIEALKSKRFDEALSAIDQALENDPGFYLAYTNKAIILGRLGRFAEAVEVLRRCAQAKPDFALAQLYQGLFLEKMGDKAAADVCYVQAIAQYDRDMAGPAASLETRMHRAVAVYLLRGKTMGTREVIDILKHYPSYAAAGLLRDRMLAEDRDFFMWWLTDAAAQSD